MEIFTKVCIACGKEFRKKNGDTRWNIRKFCSRRCNLILSGKKFRFPKGHLPWTSGTKGIQKSNSGSFKKGLLPWNKGKHIQTNNALVEYSKKYGSAWKGHKHSEESKNIIRIKRSLQKNPSKENHWNWKGGISPLRKRIQATRKYKDWRTKVFVRDDYTCKICEKRGGKINADHIKQFYKIIEEYKIKNVAQAMKCKELWNINNGRTLCIPCHKQIHFHLNNKSQHHPEGM